MMYIYNNRYIYIYNNRHIYIYIIKFHELAGSRRSSQKRKNVILSGVWNFHEANKGTKIDDAAAKRHCTTLFL